MKKIIHSIIPALVTCFDANGEIDFEAYERLLKYQLLAGIKTLLVHGSTGEPMSIKKDEARKLISFTKNITKDFSDIKIIVGNTANNIDDALELGQIAAEEGGDYLLCATGYYNRPDEEGIFRLYKTLAEKSALPLIIYNNPARTTCDMSNSLIKRLSYVDNIIGMKDSSCEITRMPLYKSICKENFNIVTGEENSLLAHLAMGGFGGISALCNLLPATILSIYNNFQNNDLKSALENQIKVSQFSQLIFSITNPRGLKIALEKIGIGKRYTREPLSVGDDDFALKVEKLLQEVEFEKFPEADLLKKL